MPADELAAVARAPGLRDRPEALRKLDPLLSKLVLATERAAAGEPWRGSLRTPAIPDGCIPAEVMIVILHTGPDAQAFSGLGFRELSHSQFPERSYAVGFLSPARLVDLAELADVVSVTGPSPLWPELDDSIGAARVDQIRSADPSATGAGVVIVIIDTGLDWKHGSFRLPDGSTRILGIWDQGLPAIAGETRGPSTIPGQGVGVVYTQDDINFSLEKTVTGPAVKVRHRDKPSDTSVQPIDYTSKGRNQLSPDEKKAHGTHVAGIAAGDGSPGACCRPSGFKFVGMAPAADLLVVATDRMLSTNPSIVNAFAWIEGHAAIVGKPVVVNISSGFNLGAHDGSTTLEKRIQDFVAPVVGQPTRVVVKSAGNEAKTDRHVRAMVAPQGQVTVPLVVPKGGGEGACDVWFPHGSGLEFEITVGTATTGRFDPAQSPIVNITLPSGAPESAATTLSYMARPASADNGQGWMWFEIEKRGYLASDSMSIKVFNPTQASVTFDAWIEKNGDTGIRFPAHDGNAPVKATRDGTLTIPGTAPDVISVANGRGSLNGNSSRGPVWINAASNPKPTVTAPGDGVKSAEAEGGDCCPCLCGGPWVYMNGGTSMAAPHVTGLVALMLQKNPNLPLVDIHTLLRNNTIDGDRGDPDGWGAGRVDGFAAWSLVTPPPAPPPPAPPPPGGRLAPGRDATAPAIPMTATPRPAAAPPLDAAVMFHPVVALASSSPELTAIASLFSRHLSEVRRLINTNRRIATLWHRADGPQLLRRLGLGTTDPTAAAPLRGAADRDYLARMFDQLVRYGSPRLQASVRRSGPRVLALLDAPLAAQR